MIRVKFQAMGCSMTALLDHEGPRASKLLEKVPGWFEEWEQELSRFRPDSDLNRLNRSAGTSFPASPSLINVIQAALDKAHWTGGLVVPTIRESLEIAGYDRDFDFVSPVQPGKLTSSKKTNPNDWQQITVEEQNQSIFLPEGMALDLGGVAKGWAAHQAMLRLREIGPALVDAGGDIAISGAQTDGQPWLVDIADPLQVQESLDMLALNDCGVATSGIDHRRWLQGDVLKHHIIDPRTGETAQTDLASVTVIAPDVLRAEAAAKTVLILGSQKGLEWLEDRPELCCGLLALQDGRLLYGHDIQKYLWSK
jgi:thiamine biosynthesis lipoprotein